MNGDCKTKLAAGTVVEIEAGASLFTDPISDLMPRMMDESVLEQKLDTRERTGPPAGKRGDVCKTNVQQSGHSAHHG
ncbi:hypothetical protein TNCV_4833051 [Trichonephila clavipes]|nr:hypothetical protein TNCV_4833051 [Trichonephila clavipes]